MIAGARYGHTNLVAADWRALARFYEEVFGCVPVPPERDYEGPELEMGRNSVSPWTIPRTIACRTVTRRSSSGARHATGASPADRQAAPMTETVRLPNDVAYARRSAVLPETSSTSDGVGSSAPAGGSSTASTSSAEATVSEYGC